MLHIFPLNTLSFFIFKKYDRSLSEILLTSPDRFIKETTLRNDRKTFLSSEDQNGQMASAILHRVHPAMVSANIKLDPVESWLI
jgi:hypothetical protein